MNFSLLNPWKIARDFASTFVVFVAFSMMFQDGASLVQNAVWAIAITLFFSIRTTLKPAGQRVFNLCVFGVIVFTMILAMVFLQNSDGKLIAEIFAALYSSYRFYEAFNSKP